MANEANAKAGDDNQTVFEDDEETVANPDEATIIGDDTMTTTNETVVATSATGMMSLRWVPLFQETTLNIHQMPGNHQIFTKIFTNFYIT